MVMNQPKTLVPGMRIPDVILPTRNLNAKSDNHDICVELNNCVKIYVDVIQDELIISGFFHCLHCFGGKSSCSCN